jgi:hypothetical protein
VTFACAVQVSTCTRRSEEYYGNLLSAPFRLDIAVKDLETFSQLQDFLAASDTGMGLY